MNSRAANAWDHLRESYWFIPLIINLVALSGSLAFPMLEERYLHDLLPYWMRMDAESARTILSTIAGTMATVVSLVFSLTILTLSLTTSQLGPRLIRTFARDTSTHVVLGAFVATVIYALILLSVVRGTAGESFVPYLSISLAIAASVFNLGYLIYFVDSIAMLIQAPNVVARVARDVDRSVADLYPEPLRDEEEEWGTTCVVLPPASTFLIARKEGYLQAVDLDTLIQDASAADIQLRLIYHPGQFIFLDSPLAALIGDKNGNGNASAPLEQMVNDCIDTGPRRTPRQDVECALLELVELAIRALSPGVNDPFTAVNCIDRLGSSLGKFARRKMSPSQYYDAEGVLRVTMPAVIFSDVLKSTFDQIRQHSRTNAAVLIRLLEALAEIARQCIRAVDARAILRQVEMIERENRESVKDPYDRHDIQIRIDLVRAYLPQGRPHHRT